MRVWGQFQAPGATAKMVAWTRGGVFQEGGSCASRLKVAQKTHYTHWGRVTHICVSKQTIIGSDNGLSPGRRKAIIWTNAGILLIGPLGTNFSENLIKFLTFLFTKMRLKVSSAKWRPFCLGLNVLKCHYHSPRNQRYREINSTHCDNTVPWYNKHARRILMQHNDEGKTKRKVSLHKIHHIPRGWAMECLLWAF